MICNECLEGFRKTLKVKPEFELIEINAHKANTVRIVDGKFKSPIPIFTILLTTDKKLKNGKTKREVSEVKTASKYCPNCGTNIEESEDE